MLKSVVIRLAAAIVCSAIMGAVEAQNYPAKPIRLIVPFTPGGGTDIVGRTVGQQLSSMFGQPVLVENRAGAASLIGTEAVAKSSPDGYTLLLQVNALAANHTIYEKLPYDTLRDFTPVVLIALTPNVLVVHPSLPVTTAAGLVALARKRPNEISYASSGVGSASYLATELFKLNAGVKMLHVPYKGTGSALVALMSGEVQLMVASLPGTISFIKGNRLRALGVTSIRRAVSMPELPTLVEAGIKDSHFETWYGLFAPAAVRRDIISQLNAAINKVLTVPDVKERFAGLGLDAAGGTQEAFNAYFQTEVSRLAKVIRASGTARE